MPDRTINFGESETEATYQIQDTDGAAGGGNFVVAKDTNANTVLLEYQPASDTWQYAGDVDMNGGNVSGVGTLTANSVNTGKVDSDDKTEGSTHAFIGYTAGGAERITSQYQVTTGVSTTATPVATGFRACKAVIYGFDGNSAGFIDTVAWSFRSSANVEESTTVMGAPASRAYSINDDDLELSMGSDTYECVAKITQFRQ